MVKDLTSNFQDDSLDDLEDDFATEYNARLNEEYEGEKERTNHEENINKRHDYLKQRLDKANMVRHLKLYSFFKFKFRNWSDLDRLKRRSFDYGHG